ncbi:CaiB/BaiF CoA transferase family protein [uncultured Jatrophihabitans sp.]|uniref:CaiB/BaiF CoA transferase family protein n=1 Tax=uncultured Jatrophihabitans sp. TaxID=1610747 RepID=UPI0035C9F09C
MRVIDFSTGISGPYATKLFADAGADVVKVEPESGDPLRQRSASGADLADRDSALFRFLNAGKRSIVGTPEDEEVRGLIEGSTLVVESFPPDQFDATAWRERFPGLVILSLTPYGRTGPWAGRPANEFVVQAEGGSIGSRGRADQVPYQIGGRMMEWTAGLYGGAAALAAVVTALRTGQGEHIDCSLIEVTAFSTNMGASTKYLLDGAPAITTPGRSSEIPSIERTSDSWVGLNTNTRQQFDDFLVMIERPDLSLDDAWATFDYRDAHHEEWNSYVRPWMSTHTTDEVVELASLLRIPVAPVCNGQTILGNEQLAAREMFMTSPDGDFVHPAPPYLLDGHRPAVRGPAPRLGEHSGRIEPHRPVSATTEDGSATSLPFAGLRVLDATAWWAGPSASQVLAALGADVIKVESIQRPDAMRLRRSSHSLWWESAAMWHTTNWNKRDLTLDLSRERGRELLTELIRQSDVMIENASPRVMERFGFDHDHVRGINPRVVYARMPAFGLTGPWRDRVGFAQTMEQLNSSAWMTGHSSDQPRIPRGPCDPLSGYHALFAILLGLVQRDQTGRGSCVESAMLEATMNVTPEPLIEFTAYGAVVERDGNRGPDAAPQGLYACAGTENWLALSVETDAHWAALKEAMGSPPWSEDPLLGSRSGRRDAHDRLDKEIGQWVAERDVDEVVADLVSRDIPAGRVTDPRLTPRHPQLAALGFYQSAEHPVLGEVTVCTLPFRFTRIPRWLRTAPPTLGQHNHVILAELGCSAAEIAELERAAVIGTRPPGL